MEGPGPGPAFCTDKRAPPQPQGQEAPEEHLAPFILFGAPAVGGVAPAGGDLPVNPSRIHP